jgi:molybdate transport system permease protein
MLRAAVTLPLILPPTVMGYYLLVLLAGGGPLGRLFEAMTGGPLLFTWKAAVVAALFYSAPLFIHAVRAGLERVDPQYEMTARSLGAGEWRVFWQISLPLAWNDVLAATALVFARSLCDFGMTLMLAGNLPGRTQTLSIAVYDAALNGHGGPARILVLVSSGIALALLYGAHRVARGSAGPVALPVKP